MAQGSKLKVVGVRDFILTKEAHRLEAQGIQELGDLGAASLEDAKQCIAKAREVLSGSPLEVTTEVPEYEDRPYQAILREALHAKCSVEIVREPRPSA